MPDNSGIKNSIADLSDKFHDSKVGGGVNEKKKIRKEKKKEKEKVQEML